jgi:thiol:disulfide interchange protein DsbA
VRAFKLVVLAVMLIVSTALSAMTFEEGKHYEQLSPQPPQGKVGDKIEVLEFFMFSCPHCYNFEPHVAKWKKSKAADVEFIKVPAMFGRHTNMHGQAFYALESMGELNRIQDAFFNEIHQNGNGMKTREDLDAFLAREGVDKKAFNAAMKSFAVASKSNRAASLMRRYGINGVPSLVVDGRYKSGRGHTFESMLEMTDMLTNKVRDARKAQ